MKARLSQKDIHNEGKIPFFLAQSVRDLSVEHIMKFLIKHPLLPHHIWENGV